MSELNALTPSAVTHVLVGVASLAMELSVQVSLLWMENTRVTNNELKSCLNTIVDKGEGLSRHLRL